MKLQSEILSALSYATSKGYQIDPDAFAMLKGLEIDVLKAVQEIIKQKKQTAKTTTTTTTTAMMIVVDDIRNVLHPPEQGNNNGVGSDEDSRNSSNGGGGVLAASSSPSSSSSSTIGAAAAAITTSKVLLDPTPNVNTGEGVNGYASLFKSRFEKTMRILAQRPDSKRMSKISTVKQMGRGNFGPRPAAGGAGGGERSLGNAGTFIVSGLLMSRRTKKNGIELEIDDYTGRIQVTAASEDVKKLAANLALDQVVMLELENAKGIQGFAVKNAFSPDIPDHLPNKSKSEAYAVLISDLHVGSKYFMQQEFLRFLEWLASSSSSSSSHQDRHSHYYFDEGGDYDEIVRKIKYLCIGGDLIDGIGIFPNQDKELLMMNAEAQMAYTTKLLSKIPKHIKTFIIPGNHDPGRRALPQPIFPKETSSGLYDLENCTMLGNPAYVELNGVKVLMFHGQSLDDVIATTPGMSYQRPAEAMKVLLKARHLSPTYGGRTPVAPETEDMMVMTEVPDIFHSGHVHVTDVDSYRGTLVVNSGAWQAQTRFQQTMGITPSPGIAIVVNLATLQPFKHDFNFNTNQENHQK